MDAPNSVRSLWQRGTAEATVARWLYDPQGRVRGLWLDDSTVLEASPQQSAELLQRVRVGDRIHLSYGLASTLTLDDRNTSARVDLGPLTPARGGGPHASDGSARPDPIWQGLDPRTDSSRLTAVGYDLDARPRVLLLEDGLQVQLPPRVEDVARGLPIGGTLLVRSYVAPGTDRAGTAARIARPGGLVDLDLTR